MVMADLPKPRETYLLDRGLYNQRGQGRPAFPWLPTLPAEGRQPLDLAKWLMDPKHPHRPGHGQPVLANALRWACQDHREFRDPDRIPRHPEPLDWLAPSSSNRAGTSRACSVPS